ncbi:MAG TPA: hypothetical protein ENG09_03255 [Candidatus Syntrophoarchaeum butanivorans]|uniref:Uncharacterized protein n=1 Tax=Candidatus Syntropharchaeum butanivorans TaxID=1839936 RepID=A0A7C1B5D2_9EURY|nr:hypothetical protein [Candidatus Syntrophoarchaeum butanivorans]
MIFADTCPEPSDYVSKSEWCTCWPEDTCADTCVQHKGCLGNTPYVEMYTSDCTWDIGCWLGIASCTFSSTSGTKYVQQGVYILPECAGDTPNCCDGDCVDLNGDVNNCGSCGHVCTASGYCDPSCENGVCKEEGNASKCGDPDLWKCEGCTCVPRICHDEGDKPSEPGWTGGDYFNPKAQGSCYQGDILKGSDSCIGGSTLEEWYCDSNLCKSQTKNCNDYEEESKFCSVSGNSLKLQTYDWYSTDPIQRRKRNFIEA